MVKSQSTKRIASPAIIALLLMIGSAIVVSNAALLGSPAIKARLQASPVQSPTLLQDWQKMWSVGAEEDDSGRMVMYNGKLYATGYTEAHVSGDDQYDAWFACINTAGTVEWNKSWSNNTLEFGNAICVAGNCIYVGGNAYNLSSSNRTAFVLKLDMNGNLVWAKLFKLEKWTYASIEGIAANGTSVFGCGVFRESGHTDDDAFVVEYADNGTRVWYTMFRPADDNAFNDIIVSGDKMYIVGTYSNPRRILFVTWDKPITMGLPTYEFGNQTVEAWGEVIARAGGYIYLAGGTNITDDSDLLLIKIAENGTEMWRRTWHDTGRQNAYGLAVNGTNLFVSGQVESLLLGDQALVARYDTNGTLLNNYTWGGLFSEWASSMAVDGCSIYTLGGSSNVPGLDWEPFVTRIVLNAAPTISQPADSRLAQGRQGNAISWAITDYSINTTTNYTIYVNGTQNATGAWISGTPITLNVSTFALGSYEVMIVAFDGFGMSNADTVILTIVPDESGAIAATITIVVIATIGGGIVLLYFLDKKGIVKLKPFFEKMRGLFTKNKRT
nr:hypothetical protein [Candidatus Sigynarchaeota archaeon]